MTWTDRILLFASAFTWTTALMPVVRGDATWGLPW
jgi:hypothetical protein